MEILTKTKSELDAQYGLGIIAQALIGGLHLESAWEYNFGGTLTLRVGLYNNIARYACFIKAILGTSQKFTPQEVQACLGSILPIDLWTTTAPAAAPPALPSSTIRYKSKEGIVDVLAWHRDDKPYVFAYIPHLLGQSPVVPSQVSIDNKFPTVTS